MKLLVVSKSNLASKNISSFLDQKELKDVKVELTEKGVLELDYLESYFPRPELAIVPSSHKSVSGRPMLSVHAPGNWSKAELGGQPKKLSFAPALYIAQLLQEIAEEVKEIGLKYDVGLEVTHHGPTLDFPVLFAEVGSSEKEWSDLEACKLLAKSITKAVNTEPEKKDVCFGFGGPHYAPAFTRAVLAGKFAVGHICPKYHLSEISEELFLQAYERTVPKPTFAALDWKGMDSEQRSKILSFLEKYKINWEKI